MSKIVIGSYQEFSQYEGKELGVSDYLNITQGQIDQFAEATLDHQWIHTDPERAKNEGAFGATIAHGYLTLSVVPFLWNQIVEVENLKMMINYGIEKLKFNQPVIVNSRVRLKASLKSIANLRGITKVVVDTALEVEGQKKNAFNAELVFLYHFE